MIPLMRWLEEVLLFRSDRALSFLLFFLIVLLFVVYPFFSLEGFGKYLIDVGFALVLISGTFAVEHRGLRRVAVGLAIVTLLTRWATYATPSRELLLTNVIVGTVFLVFACKSGIEEPSRADIAKLDKKRPKKGSNKEWVNPNEPDAEIMKMKSGGTDMAHKAEHAVDMSGEGAVIAVTLHGGAKGDTKSLPDTLEKAQSNLQELANNAECCERIHEDAGREVVGDKGYHGNDILVELVELSPSWAACLLPGQSRDTGWRVPSRCTFSSA